MSCETLRTWTKKDALDELAHCFAVTKGIVDDGLDVPPMAHILHTDPMAPTGHGITVAIPEDFETDEDKEGGFAMVFRIRFKGSHLVGQGQVMYGGGMEQDHHRADRLTDRGPEDAPLLLLRPFVAEDHVEILYADPAPSPSDHVHHEPERRRYRVDQDWFIYR